jgi:hypothetical protein
VIEGVMMSLLIKVLLLGLAVSLFVYSKLQPHSAVLKPEVLRYYNLIDQVVSPLLSALSKLGVKKVLIGKNGLMLDLTQTVPCQLGCPACTDFTYEYLGGKTDTGLDRYSQEAMPRMVVHNTHLYVNAAEEINQLVDSHVELLETVVPKDLYDVILSLHEMFADPDNAPQIYEKYIKTYKKFGGDSISTTDAENFNKFFKF